MKARVCVTAWPWLTMMPERIGIIGKTQGVSESSRPKPKKLATATQKPAPLSSRAMRPLSSPSSPIAVGGSLKVGAGWTALPAGCGLLIAASVTLASCVSGG